MFHIGIEQEHYNMFENLRTNSFLIRLFSIKERKKPHLLQEDIIGN